MKTCYQKVNEGQDRKEFVMATTNYGQIVASVAQIMWTQGSEDAINNMGENPLALEDWFNTNVTQIEVLTDLVRGELTDLKRRVIVALITVDVHARDIIEELKVDQVSSINEFKWMKQLKYYWDEDADDIRIR